MLVKGVQTCDVLICFFFEQKTAYEVRISDWSSDVCSSDLIESERKTREAERLEQEALLKDAVGGIVAAANAGDLAQRIDTSRIEGVMRELGEGVNQLLGTVERALGDLGTMLHKLAEDRKSTRLNSSH